MMRTGLRNALLLGGRFSFVGFIACAVAVACSDDPLPSLGGAGEATSPAFNETAGFDGAANNGGPIPRPSDDAAGLDAKVSTDYDADLRCCNVQLSIEDATGDEMTARLKGDFAPLDTASGLSLAWANGKWSASACIPVNTYVRYHFSFGSSPEDPDAGDASPQIEDHRYDVNAPSVEDGTGHRVNEYGPVANCADVDASTGKVPSGN